ncbi:MAG TPA: ABC transporter permease [Azospirillaceae bacterium]|nr:ABC transporter permease [Azospirillaceae bacterium]
MSLVADPSLPPLPTETHIRPGAQPLAGWLREAWQTRRIALVLAQRSLKARYKQMALGAGWAVLQPLLLMLVFWLFFGTFLKVPAGDGTSYPVFAFTGLVLWQFVARALTEASGSIVGQPHFVTKVYFPRVHLPVASLLVAAADGAAGLACLALLLALTGTVPGPAVLALPLVLLLLAALGTGLALWLSALAVRYRDLTQLLPFLTQLLMFASPVIYPSEIVPEPYRFFYALNPLVTVLEGARWALLGAEPPAALPAALSVVLVLALLAGGMRALRRGEPALSDLV